MIIPDINLLMYSSVTAFAVHQTAREWWERVLNGKRDVGLCAPTLFGFLRLATHPRVLNPPMAVDDAIGRAQQWLACECVRFLIPGGRHIEIAFDLLQGLGTGGNLTTDVQLAALAIEYQGELHSNDRDFGRFPGLNWINPLERV